MTVLALGVVGCVGPSQRAARPAAGSSGKTATGKVAPTKPGPAVAKAPASQPAATTPGKSVEGVPAQAAPKPKAKAPKGPLSGSLRSRYKFRTVDGDVDQDIYEVLSLDYVDAAHPEMQAHFLGRAAIDIDGDSGPLLSSINDSRDDSLDADVFEGYVQVATPNAETRVRLGRQSEYLTPEIAHFDGVDLRSSLGGSKPLEFGAYGGNNVTFDATSDPDQSVFGAYAQARAWQGGRARLDWMHLEDAQLLGANENDLVGLGVWQNWKGFAASGKYTRLEDHDRDLDLRTSWSDDEGKTSVRLSYYQLLETQNQRALFLDPFTQALQTYFPYHQIGVSGYRAITDDFDVDAGVDVREVNDPGDVGAFNHDWQRYYTTLTLREVLRSAWTAALTADYYDDDQSDFTTVGGDLSREFMERWDVSLGTYYSLYKYDFFTAQERDDVRSYYGKLVWRRDQMWTFELQYEFEDDDLEQYHTLRCGALCRF